MRTGLALAAACLAPTFLPGATAQPASPPDIVLVTADDLGLQLGCYGDHTVPTPNIDALAKEGILFRRAYVTSALCSPSRSSLLTGRYPHENGQFGLANEYSMRQGIPNLTSWLRGAGYYSAIFGKLHVRPERDFVFDVHYAKRFHLETLDVKSMAADVSRAVRAAGDRPAFLYVNYFDPHRNPSAPEGRMFLDRYKGYPQKTLTSDGVAPFPFQGFATERLRQDIAGYYNSVARLDAGIGLLVEALKKENRWDNTLFLFLSDNGPDFTRAKTTCYEAGLRIPLVVKWPQNADGGSVVEALVSSLDLVPTILDAAGVVPNEKLAGRNLADFVAKPPPRANPIFGEATATRAKYGLYPMRSIRDERFKLIHNLQFTRENPLFQLPDRAADEAAKHSVSDSVNRALARLRHPPEFELYDLDADPHEFVDLAADPHHAEIRARLQRELKSWRDRTGDPISAETKSRDIETPAEKQEAAQ
jgi:N-sulfoglucosamine sulfohydrolase